MLKILRHKAEKLQLDVPCICANLVELGMLVDRSFDHAACLFSTLGLLVGTEARQKFLAHGYRILKPGGVFVVHVHNRWFNVWTGQGRRLLEKAGFTTAEVRPLPPGRRAPARRLVVRTATCLRIPDRGTKTERIANQLRQGFAWSARFRTSENCHRSRFCMSVGARVS